MRTYFAREGDQLYVVQSDGRARARRVAGPFPASDKESAALAALGRILETASPETRSVYDEILEAHPQHEPFALIGIVSALEAGGSREMALRMAGLSP